MKKIVPLLIALFLLSCGETQNNDSSAVDSMSKKDSMKKALSEDLPPADEIHQFNWFYSAFTAALVEWDDTAINVCINKEKGLWVVDAPGAVPHFTKVMNDSAFKAIMKHDGINFTKDLMMMEPKQEELPKVNCDKKELYDKTGCFTTETNIFRDEKIWTYASLTPKDEDAVKTTAETITRTVMNTNIGKFYFSLINGSWYLTFIDVRKPCDA